MERFSLVISYLDPTVHTPHKHSLMCDLQMFLVKTCSLCEGNLIQPNNMKVIKYLLNKRPMFFKLFFYAYQNCGLEVNRPYTLKLCIISLVVTRIVERYRPVLVDLLDTEYYNVMFGFLVDSLWNISWSNECMCVFRAYVT